MTAPGLAGGGGKTDWPEKAIEIGGGHAMQFFVRYGAEEVHAGIIEWHHNAAGELCGGAVPFKGRGNDEGRPQWDVISEDPLELAPSILCTACQAHGFIRGGRWVSA